MNKNVEKLTSNYIDFLIGREGESNEEIVERNDLRRLPISTVDDLINIDSNIDGVIVDFKLDDKLLEKSFLEYKDLKIADIIYDFTNLLHVYLNNNNSALRDLLNINHSAMRWESEADIYLCTDVDSKEEAIIDYLFQECEISNAIIEYLDCESYYKNEVGFDIILNKEERYAIVYDI